MSIHEDASGRTSVLEANYGNRFVPKAKGTVLDEGVLSPVPGFTMMSTVYLQRAEDWLAFQGGGREFRVSLDELVSYSLTLLASRVAVVNRNFGGVNPRPTLHPKNETILVPTWLSETLENVGYVWNGNVSRQVVPTLQGVDAGSLMTLEQAQVVSRRLALLQDASFTFSEGYREKPTPGYSTGFMMFNVEPHGVAGNEADLPGIKAVLAYIVSLSHTEFPPLEFPYDYVTLEEADIVAREIAMKY